MSTFNNDITGSITITSRNKMSGSVKIIGSKDSSLPSSISTKKSKDLKSNVIIYSDNVIDQDGRYGNQIKSSIDIPYSQDFYSTISIKPKNKMNVIAEISEPSKTNISVKKIKDALIRSSTPTLNYSKYQNTFVGKNSQDEYRTLMKIDISDIPKENQIITKSELIIEKENYTSNIGLIEIYEVVEPWSEIGVTWINQPKIGKLIASVPVQIDPGSIKIDILSKVNEWYKNLSPNYGIMFKVSPNKKQQTFSTLSTTNDQSYQFGTSNSTLNSPSVSIDYYDETATFSPGISKLNSNIIVQRNVDSNLKSKIFIKSYWNKSELAGRLTVPQYNVDERLPSQIIVRGSKEEDILSNVIVSKPEILGTINVFKFKSLMGKITIKQSKEDDLKSSISIRQLKKSDLKGSLKIISKNKNEDLNSSIVVSKPDLAGKLSVTVFHDLNGNLSVRRVKYSELPSKVIISKPELVGKIKVNTFGDLPSTITVRKSGNSRLNSKMIISKPDLIGNIIIHPTSSLPSSIEVVSAYLKGSISIRRDNESNLDSGIVVRVLKVDELSSSMKVYKVSDLVGSIIVIANDDDEMYVFML